MRLTLNPAPGGLSLVVALADHPGGVPVPVHRTSTLRPPTSQVLIGTATWTDTGLPGELVTYTATARDAGPYTASTPALASSALLVTGLNGADLDTGDQYRLVGDAISSAAITARLHLFEVDGAEHTGAWTTLQAGVKGALAPVAFTADSGGVDYAQIDVPWPAAQGASLTASAVELHTDATASYQWPTTLPGAWVTGASSTTPATLLLDAVLTRDLHRTVTDDFTGSGTLTNARLPGKRAGTLTYLCTPEQAHALDQAYLSISPLTLGVAGGPAQFLHGLVHLAHGAPRLVPADPAGIMWTYSVEVHEVAS